MQNDPTAVGASDSDRPDLVDVTLQDGKYRVRQVAGGGWECLVDGEVRHSFSVLPAGDFVSALATRVAELEATVADMDGKFGDLLHVAEKTLEFFEPFTAPGDLPREHATIQCLRGAVDRAHGSPGPADLMRLIFRAVIENGFNDETFSVAFNRLPADHEARRWGSIKLKCGGCFNISPVIKCGFDLTSGTIGCLACDSEEELIMLKPGEV